MRSTREAALPFQPPRGLRGPPRDGPGPAAQNRLRAHRLCVSLNSRLESNKEEEEEDITRAGARGRVSRVVKEPRVDLPGVGG